MSTPNYTAQPHKVGDKPADFMNFDPTKDVRVEGETVYFPSDPKDDKNHELMSLPREIWQDYGSDTAGLLARTSRMYERALKSIDRSVVAPEWYETIGASLIGGFAGLIPGLALMVLNKTHDGFANELYEPISHVMMTAGAIAGTHAADKLLEPKHIKRTTAETAEMVTQARNQARQSYAEAVALERMFNASDLNLPQSPEEIGLIPKNRADAFMDSAFVHDVQQGIQAIPGAVKHGVEAIPGKVQHGIQSVPGAVQHTAKQLMPRAESFAGYQNNMVPFHRKDAPKELPAAQIEPESAEKMGMTQGQEQALALAGRS